MGGRGEANGAGADDHHGRSGHDLRPVARRGHWQPQPPPAVASLPQHVDFSLLSQHVACFCALQQPAASVVGLVALGLSEPGKRNSSVVI